MHETAIELKLQQKGTCLPEKSVEGYAKVTLYKNWGGRNYDVVFVKTEDGWIRIDLGDNTFAVGDHEG